VLVQRRIVERHPWVPDALLDAFERAKQVAYRRDRTAAGVFRGGNGDMDAQRELFGADPFPYGRAANVDMLEMAARQSHADGLTVRRVDLADCIAAGVRDT